MQALSHAAPGSRSTVLRSLAVILGALALPALAEDFPKLKPGLWEMERSSDRDAAPPPAAQPRAGLPNRTTLCLDDSVQREMFEMGAGAMKGMCSRHDFRMSGNRGTGDFVCDIGGSTMHSKSTMVMQGNTGYRTEVDTTYDPPFMGQAHTKTVITARNVGPCKAGQRPGDIVMPNGQTFNMRDMMRGTNTERPPARPR
ncbi:MAG TPA: DUF3617 family protein [Casimicrobiaceae bacterium]